jgi:hypothetical protein
MITSDAMQILRAKPDDAANAKETLLNSNAVTKDAVRQFSASERTNQYER